MWPWALLFWHTHQQLYVYENKRQGSALGSDTNMRTVSSECRARARQRT